MKILVPVKAVFENIQETDSKRLIENFEKNNSDINSEINKFDSHALEEALKLKKSIKDTKIHAISIGNENSEEILKKSLGRGADKAFWIQCHKEASNDTDFVSDSLAEIFSDNNYDLIFCGMISEDMMSGAVPHMTAGKLGISSFSGVVEIKKIKNKKIVFNRELEGGIIQKIKAELPVILGFQAGINSLSYPNVLKMLKISDNDLIKINKINFKKSLEIQSLSLPLKTRKGKFLDGSPQEKAKALIEILKKEFQKKKKK